MKNKFLILFSLILALSMSLVGMTELLGELSKEEILQNLPDWQETVSSYFPSPEVIEKLRSIDEMVQIEVVLGTWCPDSKEHVSAYLKIMEMADNPNLFTTYIGIPRDKDARMPFIEGKDIEKVPTFIITINGQEKGRIIEHPIKSIEEDLVEIISR